MPYTHPKTGRHINNEFFNSYDEHLFYEETTKRQMFLIIEQMATMLAEPGQDWTNRARWELAVLNQNGIK
jgi:hypothetical protein